MSPNWYAFLCIFNNETPFLQHLERSILEMDIQVRTTLSTISQRPYNAEPAVVDAGDQLRKRWDELKARAQNFHSVSLEAVLGMRFAELQKDRRLNFLNE